jgi:hypothetical protein
VASAAAMHQPKQSVRLQLDLLLGQLAVGLCVVRMRRGWGGGGGIVRVFVRSGVSGLKATEPTAASAAPGYQ